MAIGLPEVGSTIYSMTFPVRNLPLLQNWDCHGCSDCCQGIEAVLSDKEKRRIEELDLVGDPEIGPGPWFVRRGGWLSRSWALKQREGGGCIFLTAARRCRLHERFGPDTKPFACRLFPFLLIPAGNHWRVGMRFSCPSVAENKGRPLTEYEGELLKLSQLLEERVGRSVASAAVPPLQAGQQVSWSDLTRFVRSLVEIVQDRRDRLERRLRKCLALDRICRQARFQNVTGSRLNDFLHLVGSTLDGEVPQEPAEVPAPRWLGRVLFRTLLAIYVRKDRGQHQGPVGRGRLGRLWAGWRFVRGRGQVPRVNSFVPEITFAEVEARTELPAEIDDTLERYYLTKLNSLQFCGPPNFHLPLWAGLESLVLTLPVILWLSRALADSGPVPAVQKAILLVDNHFGGDPILGFRHIRFFSRVLGQRGELDRLVAWYSR
jgi:lysine-N-methylase